MRMPKETLPVPIALPRNPLVPRPIYIPERRRFCAYVRPENFTRRLSPRDSKYAHSSRPSSVSGSSP